MVALRVSPSLRIAKEFAFCWKISAWVASCALRALSEMSVSGWSMEYPPESTWTTETLRCWGMVKSKLPSCTTMLGSVPKNIEVRVRGGDSLSDFAWDGKSRKWGCMSYLQNQERVWGGEDKKNEKCTCVLLYPPPPHNIRRLHQQWQHQEHFQRTSLTLPHNTHEHTHSPHTHTL